ncbi:MAG TPA: exosortase/archaeosortase family protein, partial [Planctomycetota bacterium]|nr:exosortase/archaeosortase family protein [Planctomycetota bacterium]
MISILAFIPPPPGPLLGTTGTELLLFGLLIAAGVYHAHGARRNAPRFLSAAFVAVSLFYLLCPEDSAFQRRAGEEVMQGMATLQAGVMRAGGLTVAADNATVIGSFKFTYVRGCMGLSYFAMALLCLSLQPVSWRRRLAGVLGMVAGMTALNLARLIALYLLWEEGNEMAYQVFHRIGGGVFAVGGFALYCAALSWGSRRADPGALGALGVSDGNGSPTAPPAPLPS